MKAVRFTAMRGIFCLAILLVRCIPAFAAEGDVSLLTEAQVKKFLKNLPPYGGCR